MSVITTGFVSGFVQSFLASVAFQLTSDTVKEQLLEPDFQDNLTQALQNFEDEQRKKHPDEAEWHDILEDVKRCIPCEMDAVLKDVLETGAKRDILLKRWINRSFKHPQYREDVQMFCEGWVAVLFQKLYDNPGVEKAFSKIKADLTYQNTEDIKSLAIQIKAMLENLTKHQEQAPSAPPKHVDDCTEDYREIWTNPLFLNDTNFDDNVPEVLLHQVHIPHRYRFGATKNPADEQEKPLLKRLEKPGGLLVLGDPGIGKSTLITRYLNESNDSRTMLVYRLSDFDLTGQEASPGKKLLEQMSLNSKTIQNTVLFLDGLDECGLSPEKRLVLLEDLRKQLNVKKEKNVSWIVTCRRHYLSDDDSDLRQLRIPYLRLLPLDPTQIRAFLEKYKEAAKPSINEAKRAALTSEKYSGEHGSVFGIPLILYMTAAMAEIQVTEESTLVSVYDQLFEKLFERAYDTQKHVLLKDEQRRAIQTMDRHIALWMLLNEPEQAVIPREKYDSIYDNIYNSIKKPTDVQDEKLYLHKFHSYMHHTEGESERCYIHRTMYEYFVADGFVAEALAAKSAEELSGVIAWYWHITPMSVTIQGYVWDKLEQTRNKLDFARWEDAACLLLKKGAERCFQPMSKTVPECLHPVPSETAENDRKRDGIAFGNLCLLLTLAREVTGYEGKVFERFGKVPDGLSSAIRYCGADHFLINCSDYNLQGADLSGAVLSDAILSGAVLRNAVLRGADLNDAVLRDADLRYAVLSGAVFSGAILRAAVLSETDLRGAVLSGAVLWDAVLDDACLTYNQVRSIGKERLSDCRFEWIYIADSKGIITRFSRSDFFKTFFPDKP